MFPAADDYAYQIDGRITPHTSVEITKNSRETKFGGMDGGETTGRVNRGEGVSIDQALDMVGFGWGQIMVLIACGVANAADSVELASISFAIITSMECDLDLNDGRKGWIISATFIGMMVGGAFWGSLSDKYGRRKILLTALTVNLAGGLTCALVQTFWELILCRTICGLGVGGSIPILFSYYAEFLPSTSRGRSITVLAAFWMVGSIVVAVLAYLIISPKECDRDSALSQEEQCDLREINNCGVYTVYEREIGSWRIFLLSTSAPCLLAIVMLLFQPESPRWLALNGKTRKAEAVLKLLLRRNNKVLATGPIRLTTSPETGGGGAVGKDPTGEGQALLPAEQINGAPTYSLRGALAVLGGPEYRRRMVLLCCVWFFLSFGFYGFTLWLPSYYKAGGIDDDSDIYEVSIWVGLANLPGNVFSYLMVDRIGRKWTLITSLVLSGCAVFSVLGISNTDGVVAFSCVFAGVSVSAWNALDVWIVELFPTHVRSTAFGIQAACGRMGSIASSLIFGLFTDTNPEIPMLTTGITLVISSLCAIGLPNTGTGTVMH